MPENAISWRPWGPEAFAEAEREDKPILLSLVASWCSWCHAMDATSYADSEIVHLVSEHFIPIRVDTDRRPDVNDRYSMGGWPSTALLTPTGDTLTGATFIAAQELKNVLHQVAEVYHQRRQEVYQRVQNAQDHAEAQEASPSPRARATETILEEVTQAILGRFEPQYGGFDTMPKFPAPEIVDFLLFRHRLEPSDLLLGVVEATLDGMAQGDLWDREKGGFYRYANGVDWSQPHTEKMLEVNAANLSSYLHLYHVTGEERHARTAEGILTFLERTLSDPQTGAFWGSQAAREAVGASAGQGWQREGPAPVDATIYTEGAAQAVSAYLHASWLLGRPALAEKALACLEFLWRRMRGPEGGVFHYFDGSPHEGGHLRDHVYLLQALLDAFQISGKAAYLDRARELAGVVQRDFQDGSGSGYFDLWERRERLGYLRYRRKPLAENAVLAGALLTLHVLTEEPFYHDVAREILESFVPHYARQGHFAAGYAQAVARLLSETVRFHVVGRAEAQESQRLVQACLRQGYPNRVVRLLDPERDAEIIARNGYVALDDAAVYVRMGEACSPPLREAEAVAEAVAALARPARALGGGVSARP